MSRSCVVLVVVALVLGVTALVAVVMFLNVNKVLVDEHEVHAIIGAHDEANPLTDLDGTQRVFDGEVLIWCKFER